MPFRFPILILILPVAWGQTWDVGSRGAEALSQNTGGKLKVSVEQRGRYESRNGNGFGNDPDLETGLIRARLGLTYTPAPWIKISGMLQDCRAPWFGANAPNNARDGADLHEGYIELFPANKRGFGLQAGRGML